MLKRDATSILECLVKILVKCYLLVKSNPHFEASKVEKVLIYAYTGLGNFVLFTPALEAIKEYLPQASFTLLHGDDRGCHEVVTGGGLFDEYVVVERDAGWWTRLKWIHTLYKEKYDLIISEFHNNNLFMRLLTILSGARYRLGHVTSPGWNNNWDWIYNLPVKMNKNQHERDRYLELAYALGIRKVDKRPSVYVGSNDKDFAKKFLTSCGINNRDKIVSVQFGVSPGMRWKQWSLTNYRKLCDMILELPNTKVILHGSPSEVDMINSVVGKMHKKPVIAAGKTSVKQAAAIIKESDLLICNDSGLMHIAVAAATPVVAIYGPTDHTRTAPLGNNHVVVRKNLDCSPCFRLDGPERVKNCPYGYKCLNSISVDEVFEVVTKKLRSK